MALEEKRFTPNLISAINSGYQNPKGIARLNGAKAPIFRFYKEIKQKDGLSPLSFNKIMDDVLKVCKRKMSGTIVGYWNMILVQVRCFVYAFDIVIVADRPERLQIAADEWCEELQQR